MNLETEPVRPPIVAPSALTEVADRVWVIPDSDYIRMVPNIGIVVGSRRTLVIDTGFGPANSRTVLDVARRLSGGRPLFLTSTHFHPEHAFGAYVFADEATIVTSEAQWAELQEKGEPYLRMFREGLPTLGPMLDGVKFVAPHVRYTGSLSLDLGGGQIAELRDVGGGHSRGDQAVLVRGPAPVLFTGDMVEERYFPLFPDNDSHVIPWITRLRELEQLDPAIVVPGHGHLGGRELIVNVREYLEYARGRVMALRGAGELAESEIVDRVSSELLDLHPDWANRETISMTAADLSWPARG
jgi:glyoxylase-like metal-dependent hydrolase (beta-lactamase superfamily II)